MLLRKVFDAGCLSVLLLIFAALPSARSDEPSSKKTVHFRRHVINADSTFSACAAIDVNRDGKLDIVSGGFWYEAPSWKRHLLREVREIRGRYDDYSNLPLDVNGDGRLDLISANYRSRSIYWVEQPAQPDQLWTKHEVDTPGPSETGRLVDVDGDGRLDLLPNGTQFSAWWSIEANAGKPRWTRHELPKELIGHGLGFGDIDGDGRGDLVSVHGWARAPEDRRRERWTWHDEFQLHRDGSIPILVYDVDDDGDCDIVWGRGHGIGLYWLEQVRPEGQQGGSATGSRTWTWHAIDTSWSQPHALLLADIDGDGHNDLIAGKRFMGHGGKDLGEYDPLVAFWYSFADSTRTWKRQVISPGGPVGFGLDPKAVDLDGDGDLDILAPGRSGLYWMENLLKRFDDVRCICKHAGGTVNCAVVKNHRDLSKYPDASGQLKPITNPSDWALRRVDILRGMQTAMGPLPGPERRVPLDVKVLKQEPSESKKYRRQRISFAAEPGDRVPAWLLLPEKTDGPGPAMLCLHQTTRIGKDEPAGLGGKPHLHYAHELAERGYVCLVPDYPSFGDYVPYAFEQDRYDSGSMKAIWNNHRAVDLLESLPQVHPDRIGVIGHSLGGHNALFTAAVDQRLRAAVTSCGFTAFHHYYGGKLQGWTSDRYMPRIREQFGNDPDRVPFDFYEVLGAIAPRAIFINAPLHDGNFEVGGVRKVVDEVGKVHKLLGSKGRLLAVYPDAGHDFPDDVRQQAYAWLDGQLK